MRFLEDEMKRFNYTTHSVPLFCTTDVSWPIIKSLVGAFNNESVDEYISRSHKIVSGKANASELPASHPKTAVHISLCHSMKAFTVKVNKCFKVNKNFIKFYLSLLANALNDSDVLDICRKFIYVILSKSSKDCNASKEFLDKKVESDIESFRKFNLDDATSTNSSSEPSIETTTETEDELPIKEDVYLQKSKRSAYFEDCEIIFNTFKNVNEKITPKKDDMNTHFSPIFATYFVNNWCGLIPFWTSIHLGDQGRHGSSEPYRLWSKHFANRACIVEPPRTQGIIEFHNL